MRDGWLRATPRSDRPPADAGPKTPPNLFFQDIINASPIAVQHLAKSRPRQTYPHTHSLDVLIVIKMLPSQLWTTFCLQSNVEMFWKSFNFRWASIQQNLLVFLPSFQQSGAESFRIKRVRSQRERKKKGGRGMCALLLLLPLLPNRKRLVEARKVGKKGKKERWPFPFGWQSNCFRASSSQTFRLYPPAEQEPSSSSPSLVRLS